MLTIGKRDASSKGLAQDDLAPRVAAGEEGDLLGCAFSGNWTTRRVAAVDAQMREIERRGGFKKLALDFSKVGRMDTAGAWLIQRLINANERRGVEVTTHGQSKTVATLLDAVEDAVDRSGDATPMHRPNIVIRFLETIGRGVYEMRDDFLAAMNILGATIGGAQLKLGRGHAINPAAIFNQLDRMGVGAIPVVTLMSFIVGAIVAQQGAYQLRYFGADIFVVDLVGVLVLRELGVLMTAIAGGLASSTATTLTLARLARRHPESSTLLSCGVLLSGLTMIIRVAVVATALNPSLLPHLKWPLLIGGGVLAIGAGLLLLQSRGSSEQPELTITNPLELAPALKMGTLITVVMVVSHLLQQSFGNAGVLVTAAASGIADVDAISISMARLASHSIEPGLAADAILIAVAMNTLVKAVMAAWVGGSRIGGPVSALSVLGLAAGMAASLYLGRS